MLPPIDNSPTTTSSRSATSNIAQQNSVSATAGALQTDDLQYRQPLPGGGDNPRLDANENVQRRVEAIRGQLGGTPPRAGDVGQLRQRVPAWQGANQHHPPPSRPLSSTNQALGGIQVNGIVHPSPQRSSAWSSATDYTTRSDYESTASPSASGGARPATPLPGYGTNATDSPSVVDTDISGSISESGRSDTPRPSSSTAGPQGGSVQRPEPVSVYVALGQGMYLVVDPDGHQYLLVSDHDEGGNAPPNIRHATRAAENLAARAAMLDDAARQLIVRSMTRRLWLFLRLWLLSYMLSGYGTWTRVIFVILSALTSVIMETHIPRWLHDTVVRPIQRHLEELAHVGEPRQPATAEDNGGNPGDHRRDPILQGIWDLLRRTERSIVLLLASLIPGIGERQVQARNAAEAEAERARQEEQEREQTEAAAQAQTQTQTDTLSEQDGAEQPPSQSQRVASGDL